MYLAYELLISCFFILGAPPFIKASEDGHDVIIIGAGAAGLAAAKELHDSGNDNFTVLEASNLLGGRIRTVDFDGAIVDLGAQYIFGEKGNPVYKMAKDASQIAHHGGDKMPAVYNSRGREMSIATLASVSMLNLKLTRSEEMKQASGSYWDYVWPKLHDGLLSRGVEEKDMEEWRFILEKTLAQQHFGDDVHNIGIRSATEFVLPGGYPEHQWKRGYRTLINILLGMKNDTHRSVIEEKINLNKEVITVERENTQFTVKCADGSIYRSNRVIAAMPLGVLKTVPHNFWSPPLPESYRNGIENLGVNGINKIFLKFEKRWWPGDTRTFYKVFNSSMIEELKSKTFGTWPLSIVAADTVPRHPKYLVLWLIGDGSREMETKNDMEVMLGSMYYLQQMFPHRKNIIGPKLIMRTKWNTDRFIKGSQTYRTLKSDEENVKFEDLIQPLLFDGKPVLALAGEFAHPHYFGTVHGAVLSGRNAVKLINVT